MEKETHSKEKVRLKVIYKYYLTKKSGLSELTNKYPTFLTSANESIQKTQEEFSEHIDIFTSKPMVKNESLNTTITQTEELTIKDFSDLEEDVTVATTVQVLPKKDPIIQELHEDILSKIATEASNEDDLKIKAEENTMNNFFAEFGELAKQIQTENIEHKFSKKDSTPIVQEKSTSAIYDIWVNYMILNNGKTNLKNTFVQLENPWGTVASITEVQTKLNKEMGSDSNGLQIPWAIISVLPLKD